MANRGWPSTAGGGSVGSTTRQSGRGTGTSIAEEMCQYSPLAEHDGGGPLDGPDDLFEVPGNLSGAGN